MQIQLIAAICLVSILMVMLVRIERADTPYSQSVTPLTGLRQINISDLGPWSVVEDSKPQAMMPELKQELQDLAKEKLQQAGIIISSPNAKDAPELKMVLNYRGPDLRRGGSQLANVQLCVEDEVRLDRTPGASLKIVSWAANKAPDVGHETSREIKQEFSTLLDKFIADFHKSSSLSDNSDKITLQPVEQNSSI